jgi:sigma-B regulation protein RsbU (phosphoserine phosphatase)
MAVTTESASQSAQAVPEPLRKVLHDQLEHRRERLQSMLSVDEAPRLVALLKQVDAAIHRVEAGTWGICEQCHDHIDDDQLLIDPLACFCLNHLPPAQMDVLQQDLELASRIQARLLPRRNYECDGWNAAFHYRPHGPVSGDYCDLIDGPDDTLYFVLGDVSGKGVAASMLMTNLSAMFRTLIPLGVPLPQIVERVNRVFCESTLPMQFATIICGRTACDGTLELCNAGHNSALICGKGGLSLIESSSLPLGLFPDAPFSSTTFKLEPGQAIVLCTDGISEAQNAAGEEYGVRRLSEAMAHRVGDCAEKLVAACVEHWTAFRAGSTSFDDETLLILQRLAEA